MPSNCATASWSILDEPCSSAARFDLRMPYVNVIWQGDANSWCLRSFAHCQSPPFVLNITGPETLSVRDLAVEFGQHFGIEPIFLPEAEGSDRAAQRCQQARRAFWRAHRDARRNDRMDRRLDSAKAASC